MDTGSKNGILESAVRQAVEKLSEKGTEGCTTNAMDWASWNGHLEGGQVVTF